MRNKRLALTALFLVTVLAWPAFGQEQSGGIHGVVRDSSGGVLPGVVVEARSPSVVGVSTATTDAQGIFRFPALPPGRYEVTATLDGFSPSRANADLSLGQLLNLTLTLSIAGVTESVMVTGESPLIDVKQNASFTTIQRDMLDRLPQGRDFTSVVAIAAGVEAEGRSGGIQIDGSSGSENRFIIDGMDTTHLRTGVSGKTMLLDFIQEVQVKSSGYNAEFGGATGGVISAITKSGSNQIRGSTGLYYTSNRFYGSRRMSHRYWPYDNRTLEHVIYTDTPYTYLSPVLDVGGPLLKDRLWYYGGYGYTSNRYQRDAIFYADPARENRNFEWGNGRHYINYNLTTQLNNNMRLKVTGSNERYRARGSAPGLEPENSRFPDGTPSAGYTRTSFDTDPETFDRRWNKTGNDSRNDVISANLDWVLTPQSFINVTTGYYSTNYTTPEDARGNRTRREFSSGNVGMAGVPVEFQQATGYADNISSQGYLKDINERVYFNANTTLFRSWAGQHTFKAGVRFERFANDVYYGWVHPRIYFYWNQTRGALDGRNVRGEYGYYIVNQTGTIGDVHSNNWSLWLQDSWTIKDRLTINAGVRTENEIVPSYKDTPDAIDIRFGFRDKIAPRLGFAYDIQGNGKWKAYGSYGHFFDITKLEMPRGLFGGDHWINYYWTLDTYDWKGIDCGEGPTGCPGTFIEQWDARRSTNQHDPLLSEYFGRDMTGIDPNLKPVQTGEFAVGLDRELTRTMSLGVRYIHKWMTRTIEDVGIMAPGIGEVYLISNPGFGYSEFMIPAWSQYPTPKAQRDYDAIELRLRKRLSNNWFGDINYTFSRLYGNYSGLASSDEGGRTSPNVNRYFDGLYMSYDRNQNPSIGRLHTDRPHRLKWSTGYELPWGTSLGLNGIIQSGLLNSRTVNWQGYPVYVDGRGSLGRMPTYSNFDLVAQHEFRLGPRRFTLQANIDNLFDQKTLIGYASVYPYRDRFNFSNDVFFGAPWDPAVLAADLRARGATMRDNDLFLKPNSFQSRRQVRFLMRMSF
jgi:hypothetical protein